VPVNVTKALIILLLFCPAIFSLEDDSVTIRAGISQQYAQWSYSNIISGGGQKSFVDYDIEPALFTAVEGDLAVNSLGLKFGTDLEFDNNAVGRLSRISGLIGFKKLYFRAQSGDYAGTAFWKGQHPSGFSRKADFDYRFRQADAMYYTNKSIYIGLRYTTFQSPVEVYKDFPRAGVSFFDPEYKFNYYSFTFGFDTFFQESPFLNYSGEGFDLFIVTNDGFGIGKAKLSNVGEEAGTLIFGEPYSATEFISAAIQYELALGLKYRKVFDSSRLSIGAGYSFFGMMITSYAKAGGKDILTPVVVPGFTRHGPFFRVLLVF